MALSQRTLLRLHIEAVWGIQLAPLVQHNVELLLTGSQPPWKLCAAIMDNERVNIWRPDVLATERERLLKCLNETLASPSIGKVTPGISREVAFHQTTSPTISITTAHTLARPLTFDDQALIKIFHPDAVEYYFHPARQPLVGVIVAKRLVSLAHSSRRTTEACELGIDTLPDARRKGYALAATILWAELVAQEGLVPLYSTFAHNLASLKLAAAAGYQAFARVTTIESCSDQPDAM